MGDAVVFVYRRFVGFVGPEPLNKMINEITRNLEENHNWTRSCEHALAPFALASGHSVTLVAATRAEPVTILQVNEWLRCVKAS